jgi:hypothetical protein
MTELMNLVRKMSSANANNIIITADHDSCINVMN